MSTQPSGSRATELEVVMQEQDAGALERIGEPIQRIVPPSYDPSWMQPPPTPMASQATGGSHHSNSSKTWMDNYSNLMDGSGPR
jgi:hypothetical protein